MKPSKATLPAEQVIDQIKSALKVGLQTHPGLALEKVELSLKTLVEKKVGAGVEFKVPLIDFKFGGGGDLSEGSIQTLFLTLVPPKVSRGKGLESASIHQELVDAIDAIAAMVEHAKKGEPKLEMGSSGVELNFSLNSEGKVSLVARTEGKKAYTHSIKLFLKQA